jgi:hypothetical protein
MAGCSAQKSQADQGIAAIFVQCNNFYCAAPNLCYNLCYISVQESPGLGNVLRSANGFHKCGRPRATGGEAKQDVKQVIQ